MRSILQRKKGDPTDVIVFIIIIFFLAVTFLIGIFVNTKIKGVIDNTVLNNSTAYSQISSSFDTVNKTTIQSGFVLAFGLLIIFIFISSFLIRTYPVFIFIYIISLVLAVLLGVYLANSYEQIIANPLLAEAVANSPMITWIMQHSVKIIIAVGALSMIIIFGKVVRSQGDVG